MDTLATGPSMPHLVFLCAMVHFLAGIGSGSHGPGVQSSGQALASWDSVPAWISCSHRVTVLFALFPGPISIVSLAQ
jgi:hypothetical protein